MRHGDLHAMLGVPAGADTRQVDDAYRQAGAPAELRYAWKVLRDRYFASAYRRFGDDHEILAHAGWFDDGVSLDAVQDPHENLRWLTTPVHKLAARLAAQQRLSPADRPVVLLSTGAFSPVHQGHLDMMHAARAVLEQRQVTVLGGYLSPGHDAYVGSKYDGQAALGAAHRLMLCQAAVNDSDWLMVDPWEARFVGGAVNYTDVMSRLEAYLRHHVDPRITVYYVAGADNAGFARVFCDHGGFVCVARAGHDISDVAADPQVSSCERIVFTSADAETAAASSSAVRRGHRAFLPAAVREHCDRWQLHWQDVRSRPAPTAAPCRYIVRDDGRWATAPWRSAGHDVDQALTQFTAATQQLIERAFTQAAWPDQPRSVRVELLDHAAQQQFVERLGARERLLNLDICTDGGRRVSLSRMFAVSDGQIAATGMTVRPGHPPLSRQLRGLPAGRYTLMDDDIATGYTMARVRALLPDQAKVTRTVSLLRDGPGPVADGEPWLDIVDLRDLLLGARDAGLVVGLPDGAVARVPYMLPYVCTVSRAKLPPSREWEFSTALWELNRRFFAHVTPTLTVADADQGARTLLRYIGFDDRDLLEQVCGWHLRQLQQLPFTPAAGVR